jgi:CheY-like chemotaxis protein
MSSESIGPLITKDRMPHCVLIVDDSATIRKIIRAQCEAAGLEVCGEAADGLEAIEKAKELNPDLIIMDLSMPRMNGLDAARELKRICPDVAILLNTLHADVLRGQRELPVGVTEVVAKTEDLMARVLVTLVFA